jgi:hypothetical protein
VIEELKNNNPQNSADNIANIMNTSPVGFTTAPAHQQLYDLLFINCLL